MKGNRKVLHENGLLKRIFGLKNEDIRGGSRKMHNQEPHNLSTSLTIKMDIKEMRCEKVECTQLAQDTAHWRSLVNTAIKISHKSNTVPLLVE
jgi:hypothetical protein